MIHYILTGYFLNFIFAITDPVAFIKALLEVMFG